MSTRPAEAIEFWSKQTKLKRELTPVHHSDRIEMAGYILQLERELAAAKADTKRLEWLLQQGVCWRGADMEFPDEHWVIGNETEWQYGTGRGRDRIDKAVDAARTAQPATGKGAV